MKFSILPQTDHFEWDSPISFEPFSDGWVVTIAVTSVQVGYIIPNAGWNVSGMLHEFRRANLEVSSSFGGYLRLAHERWKDGSMNQEQLQSFFDLLGQWLDATTDSFHRFAPNPSAAHP